MWVGKVKGGPGERGKGDKTEGNEEKNIKNSTKKIRHRLGFCELSREKILLKSNQQNPKKKQEDNRARLESGCFQNKRSASFHFRHALCVELWGEGGLPRGFVVFLARAFVDGGPKACLPT